MVGQGGLEAVVRSQAEHIATLMAALDRQSRMFDLLLTGGPAANLRPVPPEAPAIDRFTLAELWTRYVEALGPVPWIVNVNSMMKKLLAHLAPSVRIRRVRKGRQREQDLLHGPDILASAVRPHHWTDFRDWLRVHDRKVGVGSRNLMLKRLRAAYNWACADGRFPANPLEKVKLEPKRPRRETTITEDDLARMFEINGSDVFRAYMLVGIDSGMRNREVRTLTWEQIDITTGRVILSWTATKTKRSRTARLTARALAALAKLPRSRRSSYVFAHPGRDKPYSQGRFWAWFREAADGAGIKAAAGDGRVHYHDATRHTYASRLANGGARINSIRLLLGHASLATTQQYLHTNEQDLDDAHEVLQASLRKRPHTAKPSQIDGDDE